MKIHNFSRSLTKFFKLFIVIATFATTLIAAQPAQAVDTFVWTSNNYYVAVCGSPGCPYGPGYLVARGTHVYLRCWLDAANWPKGNYYTTRWFLAYVPGLGDRYAIHASYVYYQTWTPHC